MTLEVSIVSPEEELYTGEAEFIRAKTVEGDIGVLSGHIPLLAQLTPCEVKVRLPGGAEQLFPIDGGFMTVKDNKIIILAEEVSQ